MSSAVDGLGYDLVELRVGGARSRPLVEVRIDRRDAESVTVDDCARVSRAIESRLDAEGLMGERYELQVSSPGIERLLVRPADWRRFIGYKANVKHPAVGGREVEIVGVEGEPGAEIAVLRTKKGETFDVPIGEVREARLAFYTKK